MKFLTVNTSIMQWRIYNALWMQNSSIQICNVFFSYIYTVVWAYFVSDRKTVKMLEFISTRNLSLSLFRRVFSTTTVNSKKVSGKYFPTRNRSFPLTYEMACQPQTIAHAKSWNSWNTCKCAFWSKTNTLVSFVFAPSFQRSYRWLNGRTNYFISLSPF